MITLAEANIDIDASAETAFNLWTTEDGICRWMATTASLDLRPGGAWSWQHDNGAISAGTYVAIEPHDRLVFTYGWENGPFADAIGPGQSTVEVTFTPNDTGGTTVQVHHRDVPTEIIAQHEAGWSHFLTVLATVCAGGQAPDTNLPTLPEA